MKVIIRGTPFLKKPSLAKVHYFLALKWLFLVKNSPTFYYIATFHGCLGLPRTLYDSPGKLYLLTVQKGPPMVVRVLTEIYRIRSDHQIFGSVIEVIKHGEVDFYQILLI